MRQHSLPPLAGSVVSAAQLLHLLLRSASGIASTSGSMPRQRKHPHGILYLAAAALSFAGETHLAPSFAAQWAGCALHKHRSQLAKRAALLRF